MDGRFGCVCSVRVGVQQIGEVKSLCLDPLLGSFLVSAVQTLTFKGKSGAFLLQLCSFIFSPHAFTIKCGNASQENIRAGRPKGQTPLPFILLFYHNK